MVKCRRRSFNMARLEGPVTTTEVYFKVCRPGSVRYVTISYSKRSNLDASALSLEWLSTAHHGFLGRNGLP
jgi:hypothetical protein